MVQRRERVKSAHTIADFQTLNQRQAQVIDHIIVLSSLTLDLTCLCVCYLFYDVFQAGLAVVELDALLEQRAQKVCLFVMMAVKVAVMVALAMLMPVLAAALSAIHLLTLNVSDRCTRDLAEPG
jgi:hypothetical protein